MDSLEDKNFENAEIMVVDDTPDSLQLLTTMLRQSGYRVRPADGGALALESARRKPPDLIILDVRMPEIDGYEVCRRLKASSETAKVPVIFITALNETQDKILGFQIGGGDFISKPYEEGEVLSRVRNQLEMHFLRIELENSNRCLNNERELLHTTLMSIGDGVICTDNQGRITMMNEVAKNLTGWHAETGIGLPFLTVFHIISEKTRKLECDPVDKVLKTGKVIGLANHTILISKDGIEHPIADSAAPIRDVEGNPVGVVLVFRDVTTERIHLDEIEFLSFHDQLTELYNRRFLEEELKRLDTPRRLPLTLVMGDLNGLKMTNDAFGHAAGDELLKQTARVLKQCFRQDDILCRYGGDEFVIILPDSDADVAEMIVRRTLDAISSFQSEKGILSISFGWDTKRTPEQSISEVLKNAEDNMYKRKLLDSPSVRSATINTIIKTLYEKNSREEAHSKRVSELSSKIARAMSMTELVVNRVKTAGLLHDIGKILVPDDVLEKKGGLTEEEWLEVKKHPETGYRILNSSAEMADLSDIVMQHHERWDGGGYPNGLEQEEIDFSARIIAVADAFDAMTSPRPYREALTVSEATDEIIRYAGKQFDPLVARALLDMIEKGEDI